MTADVTIAVLLVLLTALTEAVAMMMKGAVLMMVTVAVTLAVTVFLLHTAAIALTMATIMAVKLILPVAMAMQWIVAVTMAVTAVVNMMHKIRTGIHGLGTFKVKGPAVHQTLRHRLSMLLGQTLPVPVSLLKPARKGMKR